MGGTFKQRCQDGGPPENRVSASSGTKMLSRGHQGTGVN